MVKKILLILIFCLLFTVHCSLIYAARPTEVTYPEIPGAIRPVTIKTALPEYIRYAFNFFVVISGLVCFTTLIYGGITYLTSAGNPGRQKDATSQIAAAFLGIFIIFSSYLISKTINPQLVIPHAGIEAVGGLVLGSDLSCEGNEPQGETRFIMQNTPTFGEKEDGSEFLPGSLKFYSRPGELEAIFYNQEDYGEPVTMRISSDFQDCLPMAGLISKSVRLLWQLPGVYLCTDVYEQNAGGGWVCKGNEKYLGADTALLENLFNDKVRAIRLRPAYTTIDWHSDIAADCEADIASGGWGGKHWEKDGTGYCTYPTQFFGAVLHEHADFSGQCEVFSFSTTGNNVFNLASDSQTINENAASSITIFTEPPVSYVSEAGGVWLCEDVNPQRPYSSNGGFENPSKCRGRDDSDPRLGFQKIRVEFSEDKGVPNDKISSIIIDGEYIAILFDEGRGGEGPYKGTCEVFTRSDSNFRDNPIGRCTCIMGNWGCSDCLSSFIILPTKQ